MHGMWGKEADKTDKIILCATADLHLPIGPFNYFLDSLKEIKGCDLFLFAGDLVDAGRYIFLKKVEDVVKKFSCPKFTVRGNNEYDPYDVRKFLKEITLLEDERVDLKIKGRRISIIGTPGILDRPTRWQRRNIPNIEEMYKKRFERLKKLSEKRSDVMILLSHYAVTFENITKDPDWAKPELGSERWREILDRFDVVIHGHVHYGKTLSVVGKTRIYNVSLYENKKIVRIEV